MTEAEIRRLSANAAALANMLPYLEDQIAQMARILDNRMLSVIAAGEMTPEIALEGWMERAAYMKILKRFQTDIRMGTDPTGGGLKIGK